MKKSLLVVFALLALAPAAFAAEALTNGTFDTASNWTFRAFGGSGAGQITGGAAEITKPGSSGDGGVWYQDFSGQLVDGNSYTIAIQRSYASLGPSSVAECWIGYVDPAGTGGDYGPGAPSQMSYKDDCWGAACGNTGGFAQMPVDGGVGANFTYNLASGPSVWFVLKSSGWGGGSQVVSFDNASADGVLDVTDWMLY